MLPQGETSRIEKRCYGSVVESVIYRVGGADGGVAAVRCVSSRCDHLWSLAMVVTIEFGGAQRGGMPLFKMSINALYFPTVIVRE